MAVFGKGQGLAAVPVTAMAEGVDGAIWVGTALGVQRFDDGQFGPVLARPGPRQTVLSMHADAAGHLWVLTMSGLNRIAGTHFTPFTQSQGIPETGLGWIVEDDAGYFWIAGRGHAAGFAGGPGCRCRRAQACRGTTRGSAWPMGCEPAASFPSG